MSGTQLPEPWHGFLRELDVAATGKVAVHCCGGFALQMCYGLARPTADVDVLSTVPRQHIELLLRLGGRGSPLHSQFGVWLDYVTVATVPEHYEGRLVEMGPGLFRNLRLFALDPYDLVLAKLERNTQRDRDDVKLVARTAALDTSTLRQRYTEEMRPFLANPKREDLTLQLWIEAIEEERSSP